MKSPRITVGVLMAGLLVVAIDCVIYRSIRSRPDFLSKDISPIVAATLPMANLLALLVASRIRRRAEARPSRIGFVTGGCTALIATIVGLVPALHGIERVLASTGLDRWLQASPIRSVSAELGIVVGLPLLFQVFSGLIGGRIGRWVGARRASEPVIASRPGRVRLASLVAFAILAAVPAMAVEGSLKRKDDPKLARLGVGSEAVVDLKNPAVGPIVLPKGSSIRQLAGAKVRVEADRDPHAIERVWTSPGSTSQSLNIARATRTPIPIKEYIRDHRVVRVTLLDGPRAGESTALPRCVIRPVR